MICFFLSMTVGKWLLFSVLSIIFEIACRYSWTFWSDFYAIDFEKIISNGPGKKMIAMNFLWPANILICIVRTTGLFALYKRYEIDKEILDDMDKDIKEFEKKIKEKSN